MTRTCALCPDAASRGGYFCHHHRRMLFDAKRREQSRSYRRGPYKCSICGRHGHTKRTHARFGFDGETPERVCQRCNDPLPVACTTQSCRACLDKRIAAAKRRKRELRKQQREQQAK